MDWIGAVLAIGVGIYLIVALLYPEKFQ
ncbi:MAG: K(+)-transporting ATPase subunit F [Steroidobacteraceae bacterium]|nr:K(+)-transporting ATPase subunit F [Steroidobacteraceae bacterium]